MDYQLRGWRRSLLLGSMLLLASCALEGEVTQVLDDGSSNGGSSSDGSSGGGARDAGSSRDASRSDGSGNDASSSDANGSDASSRDASSSDGSSSDGSRDAGADSPDADSGSGEPETIKFVGNITTRGAVRNDFARFWNQITPENEGKWGSVQPSQGTFNWNALDAIYKYANDNNLVFKEHTFVWGAQQPDWVNNGNAETAVRTWMRSFCERYPKTKMIDVVNEPPPHTTPKYKDGIGGNGASGYDWIVNSFKWAREYCPNSILLLNDYNTIELGGDNNHIIDIVKRIKAAGAPIDAVGAQAHGTAGASADTVKRYIDNIATQTGLPVYITEFDLDIADDAQQKAKMQEHFTMFWNNPNVKGITLWGYVLGATWIPNSGLIRDNGTPRPAMTWLMDFLER